MSIAGIVFARRNGSRGTTPETTLSRRSVEELLPILREQLGSVVLLSTCARVELYAEATEADSLHHIQAVSTRILRDALGVGVGARPAAQFFEAEAARHLLRVTSGLESPVPGDFEILGQVRDAFALSTDAGAAGRVLAQLFHTSIHCGRRVRAETGLARGSVSLASAAVRLATRHIARLNPNHVIIVIGAGQMGAAVARRAAGSGASVVLVNRAGERARILAEELGIPTRPLSALEKLLPGSDCVISCTSAPDMVLRREQVEPYWDGTRKHVAVDLALPRDIDPGIQELPGVAVYDLETVEEFSRQESSLRTREVADAERIVEEELQRFLEWRRVDTVRPTLAVLQQRADAVCERALASTLPRLSGADDADRARLATMARTIAAQLLARPIAYLKAAEDPERCASQLLDLFGIPRPAPGGDDTPRANTAGAFPGPIQAGEMERGATLGMVPA